MDFGWFTDLRVENYTTVASPSQSLGNIMLVSLGINNFLKCILTVFSVKVQDSFKIFSASLQSGCMGCVG